MVEIKSDKPKYASQMERNKPRKTHTVRISREGLLYLKLVSAHDKKAQGWLIEEWATSAYAWRILGDRFVRKPRVLRARLRSLLQWEHRQDNPIVVPLMWPRDNARIYAKPYFYLHSFWEKARYGAARICLIPTRWR